MIETTVS